MLTKISCKTLKPLKLFISELQKKKLNQFFQKLVLPKSSYFSLILSIGKKYVWAMTIVGKLLCILFKIKINEHYFLLYINKNRIT